MSLIEIGSVHGKHCQNQEFDWHIYPKNRLRIDETEGLSSQNEAIGTFIVSIKGTKEIGIYCYHCLFGYIGKCIADLRKNSATEEQINEWINPILLSQES